VDASRWMRVCRVSGNAMSSQPFIDRNYRTPLVSAYPDGGMQAARWENFPGKLPELISAYIN
jgi:hypothetical protein